MIQMLVRQKYRFDIGAGSLSVITFALVATDKLQLLLGINKARYAFGICFFLGLFLVWLVGYILDRLNYIQYYNREANERNELMQELSRKKE